LRNFLLLIAGALLIALLSIICFYNKLDPITQNLISNTKNTLEKNGIYGLSVGIVGKDYKTKLCTKLSGEVLSEEEKAKALKLAKDVDGIFCVEDDIKVAKAKVISKKLVFEPVLEEDIQKEEPKNEVKKSVENKKDIKASTDDKNITSIDECQSSLNKLLKDSNINFESSKTKIKKESIPLLNKLSDVIKRCKDSVKTIVIEGYTDSSGDPKKNLILSEKRAEAVKDYLLKDQNISKSLLKAVGYGSKNPIADNTTKEGRAKNRRIEFKIEGDK